MLDTIKLNSKGNLVKAAQYMLNFAERQQANEIFNEQFAAEVGDWQAKHNLTINYEIDSNTWAAIAKTMPTCSTSKNRTSVYTCALQLLLGGLTVDGIFGNNTKKAVAAYQNASGLTADGICGPKTWTKLITGAAAKTSTSTGSVVSGDKILNNCVKYLQWDSKWKNVKYSTHISSQTIGNSGCGPTAMAMIVATFINSKITPVEMCKLAVDNGYRTYDNGTAWGFYQFIFKKYTGFEKFITTTSVETLRAALKEGALAVCSMNANDSGFWTKGGHFITARGCDSTYIYANDPNKEETPRKQATSKFQSCLKQAFIFWPKIENKEPKSEKKIEEIEVNTNTTIQEEIIDENAPADVFAGKEMTDEELAQLPEFTDDNIPANPNFNYNMNGKIIDISKWQGNIDFNKLASQVSFIIARAGVGSDLDPKFDEYAKEMIKYKIPFGVYCYSYAGTTEKARDEAQKLLQYASKYSPLFYVMDAEEEKITHDAIEAFADELRMEKANKIGCYVANHRYNQYNYSTLQDLYDFTWIPSYGSNNGTVSGSKKSTHFCDLWQYTSTGKIAGINGNVDMNIITGDGHSLEWFLGLKYEAVG